MSTENQPTPTRLAATAMAAARECLIELDAIRFEETPSYYERMDKRAAVIASSFQKHFQPLLAKVEADTAEKEELLETDQKLSELVWENASEGDDAYEVEDVLESHYKLIATLREMLAARSAFELGLNTQIAQLRADLAAKEAALKLVLPYAQMLLEGRIPYGAGADVLPCIITDARSALASRADKGGAANA